SSGSTETFRLSRLTEDISRVLKFAPDSILIAMSLSGRCALRALATNHEVSAAVLVSPVVNVRGTLLEVLGDDWFKRIAYDDSHQLYRNPVLAMKFIQIMTSECLRLAGDDADAAVLPPFSEIVAAVGEIQTSRMMEVRSYGD